MIGAVGKKTSLVVLEVELHSSYVHSFKKSVLACLKSWLNIVFDVLNFEFYYQLRTKYYKGNLRWRFGVLRFIMKKIRG